MVSKDERWREFCTSEGPTIPVPSSISGVGYHFSNLRLKEHPKGSASWRAVALHETRQLGQPELVPIIGTVESPRDPFKVYIGKPKRKREVVEPCPNPDWLEPVTRKYPVKPFDGRIEAAIIDLERRDPEFTSFITLVMDVCLDYRMANGSRKKARNVLQQFLNRRFPGHVALIFFEVDEKLAKDVDAAIIPDNSWARNISPHRLVYIVHVHGVIFTPGVRSVDLADAIRFTPNGKRSNLFSGSHQVNVQRLYQVVDGNRVVLDVRGVAGYSTKNHYRPAVDTHQLEGLPEWLLIQDQIVNDPDSVLISGLRNIKPYPTSRPTLRHFRNAMRRQWNRLTLDQRDEEMIVDDSEFDEAVASSCLEDGSFEDENTASTVGVDILNSDSPSIWNRVVKVARKKFAELGGIVSRITALTVETLVRWVGKVRARGDPG